MKCNCGREIGDRESECALCEKIRGESLIELKVELEL